MASFRLPFSHPRSRSTFFTYSAAAILLSALLQLTPDAVELWRYERSAVLQGQWWRLITGHFVHVHAQHWMLNALTGLMLAIVCRPWLERVNWPMLALACCLSIDAGLWWGAENIEWYVGLSGLWHGAFAYACVQGLSFRGRGRFWAFALLAVTAAKLGWEQSTQSLPAHTWLDMAVVVDAHLYGWLGGLAYATVELGLRMHLRWKRL